VTLILGQNLIDDRWIIANHSVKFHKYLICSFLSNPVSRQTDRQTDTGENISSLAEVITAQL